MGLVILHGFQAFQRQLLVQLTKWFKTEFFKWVNNAPCDHCGSGNTKAVGMAQPTPEEVKPLIA